MIEPSNVNDREEQADHTLLSHLHRLLVPESRRPRRWELLAAKAAVESSPVNSEPESETEIASDHLME